MKQLIEVAILSRGSGIYTKFDYYADSCVQIGQRVEVPFGKGSSVALGMVVGIDKEPEQNMEYKDVLQCIDETPVVDQIILDISKEIADEYLCSFQDAVGLFLPRGEKAAFDKTKVVISLATQEQWQEYLSSQRKNAYIKLELARRLSEVGELSWEEIRNDITPHPSAPIQQMEEKGLVKVIVQEHNRFETKKSQWIPAANLMFSKEQNDVIEEIWNGSTEDGSKTYLIHGITGSGKTEIYIELIRRTVQQGKQAIVLVPEISLTPQMIERFQKIFEDRVAFLHSALTEKEKKIQWHKMKQGACSIAIGPRSALFVPFWNLGMIIVDECHEDTYHSEMTPRYDAVEVAKKLGDYRNATVVLGSATPTIEQLYDCQNGSMIRLNLENRVNGAILPQISVVDMREELRNGNNSMFSGYLSFRIRETLEKGEQVLLFLNKRGFSKSLTCTDCGYVHKCPNCDITLTYHKQNNALKCHYCNYQMPFDRTCPDCGGILKDISFGTQKIQELIEEEFSNAKVIRMDRDTTEKRGQQEQYLKSFERGEANVLIGTQMIGKGLNFPHVTLVGILQADQRMDMPDYRGSEKVFQMLEQVSGRAGRFEKRGESVIQTYRTESSIFHYLLERDYDGFYQEELAIRKAFFYPPYGSIFRIVVSSVSLDDSAETAKRWEQALHFYFQKRNLQSDILGPAPCLIQRLEKKYRWHLLIKVKNLEEETVIRNMIRYLQTVKRNVLYGKKSVVIVEKNPRNIL